MFSHLTTKQEPYFAAEVILNTRNVGSNFKTFKLTTDDPTTLGEFVHFLYTVCPCPKSFYHSHPPAINHRMDLIKHTNAKPEFLRVGERKRKGKELKM